MTAYLAHSTRWRLSPGIAALAVAGILFTSGFACAVPLAAFAVISAMSFARREAFAAIGAVWFANQFQGFTVMHYPMDGETFAWGAALGVISLLSCAVAILSMSRVQGAVGVCAAFLAAFAVYEGSLIAIDLATGRSADDFALATVARIFLINACAFGGLWALKSVLGGMAFVAKSTEMPSPRHV